jgi:hypothetical protein
MNTGWQPFQEMRWGVIIRTACTISHPTSWHPSQVRDIWWITHLSFISVSGQEYGSSPRTTISMLQSKCVIFPRHDPTVRKWDPWVGQCATNPPLAPPDSFSTLLSTVSSWKDYVNQSFCPLTSSWEALVADQKVGGDWGWTIHPLCRHPCSCQALPLPWFLIGFQEQLSPLAPCELGVTASHYHCP